MKPSSRVGSGKCSFLRFDGLLSRSQQMAMQDFVASRDVQLQLFAVGTNSGRSRSDRNSRIAQLGRPGSFPEPTIPTWCDRKLRHAVRAAHAVFGNRSCPLGLDRGGRSTPRYEPVQYAEYGTGGHYSAWHTDADPCERDVTDLRCISIVLMISESSAYEAGELEVQIGGKHESSSHRRVLLRAGDAVAFPSKWLVHRVRKCKKGLRQTLVFWARRPGGGPLG